MEAISLTQRQFLDGLLSELETLEYTSLAVDSRRLTTSMQVALRIMPLVTGAEVELDGFDCRNEDMYQLVQFAIRQSYLISDGEHYQIQSSQLQPRVGYDELWRTVAITFLDVYKGWKPLQNVTPTGPSDS